MVRYKDILLLLLSNQSEWSKHWISRFWERWIPDRIFLSVFQERNGFWDLLYLLHQPGTHQA